MVTYEDIVKHGETKFSPKFYRHWRTESQYIITTEAQPLYEKGSVNFPQYKKISKPTLKDKQKYFIITSSSTPTGNIKEYVKMANGKLTKDLDKADYIVFDESAFKTVEFQAVYKLKYAGDVKAVITSATTYQNWHNHQDIVSKQVDETLVNTLHNYYSAFYKQHSIAAAGALDMYPEKILHPYDLGIASGSITELTEETVKSVLSMINSSNNEDKSLANHMIGTFNYEKDLILTWEFSRTLYRQGYSYYLNRRMKSVRNFIDKYYEKFNHMDAAAFFRYCELKDLLTPQIFSKLYKSIQSDITVLNNPGVYTLKFEMKPEYKELLKQNLNAETKVNI